MKIVNDTIQTKIGRLFFHCHAASGDISNVAITMSEIQPRIPNSMEVESCIAVLLTLKSSSELTDLTFSCLWRDDCLQQGSSCSGEGLEAWEWAAKEQLVIIGTEDIDWLSSRLKLGKSAESNYRIAEKKNGITIEISRYPANNELTLHFIIASNPLPEKVDSSCWFAVDVPHELVIQLCIPKVIEGAGRRQVCESHEHSYLM